MSGALKEQCSLCRFWLLDPTTHFADGRPFEAGDIAFGYCRRNAPAVRGELAALCVPRTLAWACDQDPNFEISSTQLYRASPQPATESGDWCGEFEPNAKGSL